MVQKTAKNSAFLIKVPCRSVPIITQKQKNRFSPLRKTSSSQKLPDVFFF